MKDKLAQLPLATKAVLITPAALLLVLLVITTPALGIPLVLALLAFACPHLFSPRWWKSLARPPR
ncbi:hypothetical protein KUV38_00370 [Vannielia litorea]|uniref:hypothetical protein n=1 Tax=Vannielia litorea TaxID=1217970 RepID=UPI001C946D61|nr:hypothetical protein [Vannielia litorea]MBY6046080.1 hypothetical protein [Vannielia litorea]